MNVRMLMEFENREGQICGCQELELKHEGRYFVYEGKAPKGASKISWLTVELLDDMQELASIDLHEDGWGFIWRPGQKKQILSEYQGLVTANIRNRRVLVTMNVDEILQ